MTMIFLNLANRRVKMW